MKKKVLSLVLALVMVLSLAACGDNDTDPDTGTPNTGTPNTSTPAPGNSSDESGDNGNAATYTYDYALAEFPTNWSPFMNQTSTDSEILDYIVASFWTFDYNDTMDGYQFVPQMAVGEPEDVTSQYVGQYGVEAGDTAKVWKVAIRDDIKWEDGTPINANDFVTSVKLMLDPVAQNSRADLYYASTFQLHNAKSYLYSGQHAYVQNMISEDYLDEEYVNVDGIETDADGYFIVDGKDIAINLNDGGNWGTNGLADYYDAYGADISTKDGVDLYTEVLVANADAKGYVKINQETFEAVAHIIANLQGFDSVEDYAAAAGDYAYQEWEEFCYYGEDYEAVDFSEVGVFAPSDYEVCFALDTPLEGFYLKYSMPAYLVKEDLYNSCASETNGVYTNSYCTSAETTVSYGPYKLVSFQADKEYVLEKNENFFGFEDGQYQTTHIKVQSIPEPATRLEAFLSGDLDSYGLTADDMATYASSEYTYYSPGDATYFIVFNADPTALANMQAAAGDNINKTILTVREFRQALSFAVDRRSFALATSPTNNAAFGLFSELIISDPDAGTTYRSLPEAKQVLADFWGVSDEIGNMYADIDEALDSISGYNLEMAKEKFIEAYNIAIESGLMGEDDVVQIMIGTPNSTSSFYNNGYEFLVNTYTEAVVGTPLEGKLTFTRDDTLGNGFGEALRANQVDMLFGVGFTGSTLDPYSLVSVYTTDQSLRYNPHWDTTTVPMTVSLSGTNYTASIADWTDTLSGIPITITADDGTTKEFSAGSTDGNPSERAQILVAIEGAVLDTYETLPLIDASSAGMKGMQIQYYTEDYIFGMGRGGVQYMTYNYSDEEWAEFVSSQGGTLNYN